MHRRYSRLDLVGAAAVAATLLASVAAWPRLPAEMAVHFSATGTPSNYVPRAVGVLVVPAVMAATLLVLKAAVRVDPPGDDRMVAVTTLATVGLLAALQAFVLGWNLGYRVPAAYVTAGVVLWGAALVGYALLRERGGVR